MEEPAPGTFSLFHTCFLFLVQIRLACRSTGMCSMHSVSLLLAGCSLQAEKLGVFPNHPHSPKG